MAKGPEPEEGSMGWRLKAAAKRSGKSAEEISQELKQQGVPISPTSVRRWWRAGNDGGRYPRGRELVAYAAVVGTTVEELGGNGDILPESVLGALVVMARHLAAGATLATSAEKALGQPGVMLPEEEARLATEAEVMRRFVRDLGALTDQELKAILRDLHERAHQSGRRGGSAIQ